MAPKTTWLQLRVSPDEKARIRAAAEAAGLDLSTFVLSKVLRPDVSEFDGHIAWMREAPDSHVPYAEFVDYLNTMPAARGAELAAKPASFDKLTPFQQNNACALIEQRCYFWGVHPPAWLLTVPALERPHFAGGLLNLRPYQLVMAPVVFRRRNIFAVDGLTGRLAYITPAATAEEAAALAAAFAPAASVLPRRRVAEDSPAYGNAPMLTRSQIRGLLEMLDLEITRLGVKAELLLVGGAVMTLVFQAREQTKDIDAVFEPAAPIRAAVARIAEREGLPPDWLNDAVSGVLAPNAQFDPYFEGESLRVLVARADYLLAMKALALREAETYRDQGDIRFLCRFLGLSTAAQVMDIVEHYYPRSRIQPRIQFGLEELLEGQTPDDGR